MGTPGSGILSTGGYLGMSLPLAVMAFCESRIHAKDAKARHVNPHKHARLHDYSPSSLRPSHVSGHTNLVSQISFCRCHMLASPSLTVERVHRHHSNLHILHPILIPAASSIRRYPTIANMIATAHPSWAHTKAEGYMNQRMLSRDVSFGSGGTVFC